MSDTSIAQHLDDLQRAAPDHYEVVQRIREMVRAVAPDASERVVYGGIMFAAPVPFCGVFAYTAHVSLEFGKGYELADPWGVLEGSGKLRRHIKIGAADDLDAKHVRDYIAEAHDRARPE